MFGPILAEPGWFSYQRQRPNSLPESDFVLKQTQLCLAPLTDGQPQHLPLGPSIRTAQQPWQSSLRSELSGESTGQSCQAQG